MSDDASVQRTIDENARRRFEAARFAGNFVSIESILPPISDHRYLATVEELVKIDLEFAWKTANHRAPLPLEDYLTRFPALRDSAILRCLQAFERQLREPGRRSDVALAKERSADFADLDLGPFEEMDNAKAMLTAFAIPGFEIVRELGRGAMGVVYLSRQISLKRAVALKIIHHGSDPSCEKLARFRAEAEAVARLQHPHIVQIFEVGEHAGEAFIALEYVEGGSLAGRLREAPLDVAAAVALMATIARAVQHAHERDIVHRDLKPANILLTPAGVPKIADFGLAKFLGAVAAQRTKTGDILGTPTYMSPEQATGVRRIGPTTDVYALGAMLYELLTGQPPFSGKSSHEMLQKVIHESPIPLSKLSTGVRPELEAICLKCLVKEPSGRYPSAIALAEALERFQESPSDHGRGGLLEMARRKLRGYWPK